MSGGSPEGPLSSPDLLVEGFKSIVVLLPLNRTLSPTHRSGHYVMDQTRTEVGKKRSKVTRAPAAGLGGPRAPDGSSAHGRGPSLPAPSAFPSEGPHLVPLPSRAAARPLSR